LKDILDAIERIQEFTEGMTFAEFDKNRMASDAIIRNFEIIGEAGNHIPIHEYFGADNSVIWDTIQIHLPGLKSQLLLIIADNSNEQGF
jgi:uncharacterized protein with HEPN domain